MALSPIRPRLRCKGYVAVFRHPVTGRVLSAGLGTRDLAEAEELCADLTRLRADRRAWEAGGEGRLALYSQRAVEILFGRESEQARTRGNWSWPARLSELLAFAKKPELWDFTGKPMLAKQGAAAVAEIMLDAEKARDEQTRLAEARRLQIEQLQERLYTLERSLNRHVKVTMGAALTAWAEEYGRGHARRTLGEVRRAVESFISSLPDGEKCSLGGAQTEQVDAWLSGLLKEDGESELSPVTRKRRLAYLSTFFTWARRRYRLAGNPCADAAPIAGLSRHPEQILAIRRYEDLTAFLDALKPWPYWRAWAAVACLAGLRYSEQVHLRREDVYLTDGYLRVATRGDGGEKIGTKTGRERSVPIEATLLLPILTEHLRTPAPHGWPWVFPTLIPGNKYKPRKLAAPGTWSSNRNWRDGWNEVAKVAAKKAKTEGAAYWKWGPREWRHTFGTVLGMCGWTSLEIARVMGNSPGVAERHYVAATSAGKRWGLKFR